MKKTQKIKKLKEKKKQKWYHAKRNSNIYVNGLPKDVSLDEIKKFFTRAGVIRFDIETGDERIKLYKDRDTGVLKGDALISYANEESVDIATNILSGKEIRPGYPVSVERAQFEQKGDYKPRTQKQIDELAKIKYKANQEKLMGWKDDDDITEGLRIVILRNMFGPEDFTEETRAAFFELLEQDIRIDFEEKFGVIKRIKIFEHHPDGVVQIKFERASDAENCIKLVNHRLYNGRRVECFYWDGKTNYKVFQESEEDQQKRIDEFGKWLSGQIESQKLFDNL